MDRDVTLVVCAGGRSRRWGGLDKTAQPLAGRPVIGAVVAGALAGLADAGPAAGALAAGDLAVGQSVEPGRVAAVVIVAPSAHPARDAVQQIVDDATPLVWTLEDPPDGGPVAGLAAALVHAATPLVVVLAGDAPFAGTALPRLLEAATAAGAQGAVGIDPDGVRQRMLAVYETTALRTALAALDQPGQHDQPGQPQPGPRGASMRSLQGLLTLAEVPVTSLEATDLDTLADLELAEQLLLQSP